MSDTDIRNRFPVGSSVQLDPAQAGKWLGVTFEVKQYLRTTVLLKTPEGSRDLKAPISMLVEPTATASADRITALFGDHLVVGTVVTIKTRPGLWVILAQNSSGKYRAARLGGNDDRYLTNITRNTLTPLSAEAIANIEHLYAI